MADLPSLSDVARAYVGYVAGDASKSPIERVQELHRASVAFSSIATRSGDLPTLDYLISDDHSRVLENLVGTQAAVSSIPQSASTSSTSSPPSDETSFLALHSIDPSERYSINECLTKLPAPTDDIRRNLYQRLYVSSGRQNADLPIQMDESGKRTNLYVVGKDIPLLWKYMLDNYDDVRSRAPFDFVESVNKYVQNSVQEKQASESPAHSSNGNGGNGTNPRVVDNDIITVDNIASLMGRSRDDVLGLGIALQGAGTTQYARVSSLFPHLNDAQRADLQRFVE